MTRQFVILLALILSGCAHQSQNRYSSAQVGQPSLVEYGTVVAARGVDIKHENTGVGAAVGAGGGALAGSAIGHGSLGGLLGGALIGGVAGAATEQVAGNRQGIEYTIKVENGATISIVQNIAKDDRPIVVGQRVMVQSGPGYQRVLPADDIQRR
jgi:outer membrane lipoprotein SlyB